MIEYIYLVCTILSAIASIFIIVDSIKKLFNK